MVNALKILINDEVNIFNEVPKDFDSLIILLQNIFTQLKQTSFSIQSDSEESKNVLQNNNVPKEPITQIQEKIIVIQENIPQQAQEILNVVDDISKIYQKISDYQREVIDVSLEDNIRKILKIKGVAVPSAQKLSEPQNKIKENNTVEHDKTVPKINNPPKQIYIPKADYDVQFIKEVSQIPQKVTTRDTIIKKTIVLKNTGRFIWEKGTRLVPINTDVVFAKGQELFQVQQGHENSITVHLHNPQKVGEFTSMWRLHYYGHMYKEEYFGEQIPLTFVVDGGDNPGPLYSKEILEKANELQGVLVDVDIMELQQFVKKSPEASIEELVNAYFQNN